MITISPIKNSTGAATYYDKEDNYYLSEVDAKEASQWLGIGADKLGLAGKKIEKEDLQKLMEGKLSNGVTIGLKKDGSISKHRPGYDLCFHAPKSVSILALDGGDNRFYKAHLEAVKEALKAIEEDCAQARVFKNGKMEFENTKNLTIALIKHTASRSLDPHLHHHALVMNATERQDKAWKALASSMAKDKSNGFSEQIYKHQIYYGLVYQSSLANKVMKLGCEIEIVGKNGMWEIKGVPKEARDTVSKRRKQIEAAMEKLHYHSKKAADIASLDTREAKPKNISLVEMRQTWRDELAMVGFSSKEFLASLAEFEKNKNEKLIEKSGYGLQGNETVDSAAKTVKDAAWYLSQYKLKLDYVKIISQAMEFAIGKTTHSDIVKATNQLIADGFFISLDKSDTTFVTKELIETEKAIMDFVDRGKNQWSDFIKDTGYDAIYTEAEKHASDILQSKHRLNLVESNTDNKDLIEAILNLAESSGKTVRVLSPNRLMANDINENITRRKPDGLWQWLISLGRPEIGESVFGFKHKYKEEIDLPKFLLRFKLGKDVILINNTEALGCNDTKTLIELTEKSQAKVMFLQDTTDKRSLDSGNLIETLKQAGIKRFKFEAPVLEELPATLKIMPELKIIKEDNKRTLQLAKEYAKKSDEGNTIVLVGSKERLNATNEAIRKELKEQNKLTGLERDIPVLNPVYMSKPEAVLAHKYQQNMVIRFYNGAPDDWSVSHCDREANTLKLARGKRRMVLDFKKHQDIKYGVFKKEVLQIAKGDKLITSSNMYNLGIKNGEKFIVSEINEKYIKLDINTKAIKLSLAELKDSHFQYDYVTTINKSLKKPVANIIADFKTYLLDKPTIDVLTKQAKEALTIFTDSEAAQKRFGSIPVRITAAEMLFDASESNKNTLSDKTISEIKSDLEKAIETLRDQYKFRSQDEQKAVEFALEKITSRNAGFDRRDLGEEALKYALNELISKQNTEVLTEDIGKVIKEKLASGELVIGQHADDGVKLTTKEILELERSIIADLKKGADKLNPLIDPKDLKIPEENLTKDQKDAISLIVTTKDQYVVVQGYAGTGKTTMFLQVKQLLKETSSKEKIKMLGLAPTHEAVKKLKAIGIKAQTLKSFLIGQTRLKQQSSGASEINRLDNKLIILDEVSMVPNKDYAEFISITNQSKAHVAFSGDRAQHLPISSGKPVEITQDSKILKIAFLREIVRQKNPNIKEAVESVINHNYLHAINKIEQENPQNYVKRITTGPESLDSFEFFKNLQKSVIEIDSNKLGPEEKTLEEMVANDFLTRTPEIRDQTVIIVHANDDRAVITEYIRNGLKKQGVIEKTGIKINRLTAKGLTDAEHKSLLYYSVGDVVKIGRQYYHVASRDIEAKSLLLKDGSGKTRYFYPEKEVDRYNMELYSHTKEELAVGDVIRLTKTDKNRSLFANFKYQVKEINDKQVVLESKEKSQIVLNHKKLKDSHWDYAQTVTGYGIQGGSEKYAISFEVSYRKFLANVRSFYISISRAIEHIIIYTDSKEKFLQRLFRNKGDKYSALEITGELEKLAKSSEQSELKRLNTTVYTLKEIKQSLENQAENIVERLLGKPNTKLSSAKEWRYGNKGSLVINLTGSKRGLWKNFETGESGNLIGLIQKELNLSFPEVLKYTSDNFGGLSIPFAKAKATGANSHSAKNDVDQKNSKTSEYAQKLARESLPIAGTIVEKYLVNRGIKNTDSENIRYHPKVFTDKNEKQKYLPAMLSIGRDKNGNIQCVQATYLDPKTTNKADVAVKKRTYASPSGSLVSLQANKIDYKNKISFIAEGTETGLSIRDAIIDIKNSEAVVTLGKSNFTTIDPKSIGDKIVFCLDNDGPATFADGSVRKAAERLIGFGKEVFISIPEQTSKGSKIDFNDVARTAGINKVQGALENSVLYKNLMSVRGIEINHSLIEKTMHTENVYLKSQVQLSPKSEINLNFAAKLISTEKSDFGKYINSYNQIQHGLYKHANMPKVNVPEIQKNLSKIEKEIY